MVDDVYLHDVAVLDWFKKAGKPDGEWLVYFGDFLVKEERKRKEKRDDGSDFSMWSYYHFGREH